MGTGSDTIFALASGIGRAGVAVLRVSGDRAGEAVLALAGRLPPPRRASLRRLRNRTGEILDDAIILWFPAPSSYTGECCAEFQLHGGAAVLSGVSDALIELGLRPAEPGEFTHRAFLNGRMDLTEAEAVADLIEAETASQRVQALRQLGGELSHLLGHWRRALLELMANQEALVDFPDEDLPSDVEALSATKLELLITEIGAHLDDDRRGERLRAGITIVVSGAPNAGKSSLVNYLAGRDLAIVSPIPGTTRDALEARLVLSGVPVTLVDTAGLRQAEDPVEAEGVRRALARAAEADIVLRLTAADESDVPAYVLAAPGGVTLKSERRENWDPEGPFVIEILSKIDRRPPGLRSASAASISLSTGEGLDALIAILAKEVRRLTESSGGVPLTRARHRAALQEVHARLRSARQTCAEVRAEDMRLALRSLGRITGEVGVEEILGQIFSKFCIGK